MPRAKKIVATEQVIETPVKVEQQPAAPEVKPVDEVVTIVNRQNPYGPQVGTKRTFSRAQHGEGFKEAAKAYCERFGATLIVK